MHTHSYIHMHTHTCTRTFTLTHTVTHPTLTHTHTLIHSHTHSDTCTLTHTHHTHTHHTDIHMHTHTLTRTHTHSYSHTHAFTHTLTHTLTHTRSHTHTPLPPVSFTLSANMSTLSPWAARIRKQLLSWPHFLIFSAFRSRGLRFPGIVSRTTDDPSWKQTLRKHRTRPHVERPEDQIHPPGQVSSVCNNGHSFRFPRGPAVCPVFGLFPCHPQSHCTP